MNAKKNVDNYNGRNFKSHAAPAERLSTVSSPFMVFKSGVDLPKTVYSKKVLFTIQLSQGLRGNLLKNS